jgi:hypothetical protein
VLRLVYEDAQTKLTRQQTLDDWPPDFLKPSPPSLWRWLDAASERGLLHRDGRGRRSSPFRYWLPNKLEKWLADPLLFVHYPELFQEMRDAERIVKQEKEAKENPKQAEEGAVPDPDIPLEDLFGLLALHGSRAKGEA